MNKENKKYGYIGLWRSLLSWEWFQEPNTLSVFIYCLLRACPKEDKWQGKAIKRGSFITSLATISRDTGLTVQQTRTALEHLETTGEITKCSTSKYSVITVKNYDFYQVDSKQNNKQSTKYQHTKRQTNNKLITTDKNKKRGCLTNQVRQPNFYAKKEGDFGEEVSKMVYNVVDKKTKPP